MEINEAVIIVVENFKRFEKFKPLEVLNLISYEKWQYVDNILLDFPNTSGTEYLATGTFGTKKRNTLIPDRVGTIPVHSREYFNRYKLAQLKATIVIAQRQMLKQFFTKNLTRFCIAKLPLITNEIVDFMMEKDLVHWYSSCGPEDKHLKSLLQAIPHYSCEILADFSRMDISIIE